MKKTLEINIEPKFIINDEAAAALLYFIEEWCNAKDKTILEKREISLEEDGYKSRFEFVNKYETDME